MRSSIFLHFFQILVMRIYTAPESRLPLNPSTIDSTATPFFTIAPLFIFYIYYIIFFTISQLFLLSLGGGRIIFRFCDQILSLLKELNIDKFVKTWRF